MVVKKKNISLEELSREILGILTMVLGLFVLLSLISHEPSEELPQPRAESRSARAEGLYF